MSNQNKTLIAGKFKLSEQEEQIIRKKVSELSRQERLAIYFLFWEQHSLLRIAHEMRVSVGDVSLFLSSGMAKLRQELTHVADSYFGTINTVTLEQVA